MKFQKFSFQLLLSICCTFFSVSQHLLAEEIIHRLDSDIQINKDGSLFVKETISVRAEVNQIKHGIFRTFPTEYQNKQGEKILTEYNILTVVRDGSSEPFHIEHRNSLDTLYIGDKNHFVSIGEHRYEISYRTNRQVSFFEDHDELYYNAIGTGWIFPIQQSTVRVSLPGRVLSAKHTSYTGRRGSTASNAYSSFKDPNTFIYELAGQLAPQEGFTIVASWQKGLINAPSQTELAQQNFQIYLPLILTIGIFALSLSIYYILWNQVGKDNLSPSITPLYTPPPGLSPTACQYLKNMGFQPKMLSTVFISLASKRLISINKTDGFFSSSYSITKLADQAEQQLPPEEQVVFDLLPNSLDVSRSNSKVFRNLQLTLQGSLEQTFDNKYFLPNQWYTYATFPLIGLSYLPLWLSQHGILHSNDNGIVACFCLFAINAICWIAFRYFIPAPTDLGRPLVNHIFGFKSYLAVADRERLNLLNAPGETLELFEKYLPFAVALDVANNWATRFSSLLASAETMNSTSHGGMWYRSFGDDPSSIGSFSKSFESSLASASGQNSSGFSGGSSGGGGGGGGGGGW